MKSEQCIKPITENQSLWKHFKEFGPVGADDEN